MFPEPCKGRRRSWGTERWTVVVRRGHQALGGALWWGCVPAATQAALLTAPPSLSFQSWTHNIQREKEFLRKLVKARVITDLTSGI